MQRFPKPQWIVMEKDAFILLLLHCLLLAVWGNSCLISALSAKEHTNLYNESQSSQAVNKNKLCNETAILEVMQICGKSFEEQINQIHPKYWCNFTHIVRPS
ncbi:uncharacterized protein LOC103187008 isoform X2 [Callorhinchus milii]|uniref:uncharacterized protein LOC103187008 isoform X2 n=1 Tax=Callorhinchus milii TaxID=7868 RepID=UPI0004574487|nr:uncharacterized protein LOC103187008 isoform X2 [Callorhinchus milii]|eukprot:gi/632975949/ref/XP_007904515.1/ PREDICTED: uncharacterized protein LOC103187008 isoform X2 [Callorhinchus milii]